MNNLKHEINSFLKEQECCLNNITNDVNVIKEITKSLIKARNNGKKILAIGNGGSGSTASHFVSDLLKTTLTKGDKRFKAISLVDNVPVLLAWSNDVSYDDIFTEQLKNHLSKNDIVFAFSGSGNSKNIVRALTYASKKGAFCIGMTGKSGGAMKKKCDLCLRIPSDDMLTIESQQLTICHCIVTAIRAMGKPVFKYE